MPIHVPNCTMLLAIAFNAGLPAPAAAEWLEHRKLFGSDISSNDVFGEALTIDGDRLAVGADQGSGFDSGTVYIFERNAGGPERWGEVARLKPSDGQSGWLFGTSLALDGDRRAVAAAEPDLVYVFERQPDGSWKEVARLEQPPDPDTQTFATCVAIEGNTVFVGSEYDDEVANNAGALWVFERDAGGPGRWGLAAKLTSERSTYGARFGVSAAVNGGTLVVGAHQDSERAFQSGAAHIFERQDDGTWLETAKLMASDGESLDWFGESVAVSGSTIVVGTSFGNPGAAYVFERSAEGVWTDTAKLTNEESGRFGDSVAIWRDLIAVGAQGEDQRGGDSGAAYLFARLEAGWAQLVKLEPDELEHQDNFGVSVAVGARTVVVGSYLDDDRGGQAGAAYLYLERDLELALAGVCPGEVTLTLTGATASAPIAVLSGLAGEAEIPAGPCAGTRLELSMPRVRAITLTDSAGGLSITRDIGPQACGTLLQVLDAATCATSEVEALP